MGKSFITITGLNYRYGSEFIEKGMEVELVKEPDNEFDKEAIKVEIEGLGIIGYVANSPRTVLGESMSAGRLYDKIDERATATVIVKVDNGVICRVNEKSMR